MAAWLRGRGNQPKSRGGNIARNDEVARLGNLIAENADRPVLILGGTHQKIIKHQLGVVPTGGRFIDAGLALGKETGNKNSAFDLRAGNRRTVMNPAQ